MADPIEKRCVVIADRVEPDFRGKGRSCYSHSAKRWQAAYDGALIALTAAGENPAPEPHVTGWENEEKLTVEEAWTILCETPDITSPEEYPDHALITMEQLGSFMARAISGDARELLMAIENAARMAEQGVLSMDGGQAAVEIRSLVPARFRSPPSPQSNLGATDFAKLASELNIDWVRGLFGTTYGSGAEFLTDVAQRLSTSAPVTHLVGNDAEISARLGRLLRVCHQLKWTKPGILATDHVSTQAALSELAELLFADALAKAMEAPPQAQMTGVDEAPYPVIPVAEIKKIREALHGVTAGPWSYTTGTLVRVTAGDVSIAGVHRIGRQDEPAHSNARYLAAVNPTAIKAILAFCDALSGTTGPSPAPQEHVRVKPLEWEESLNRIDEPQWRTKGASISYLITLKYRPGIGNQFFQFELQKWFETRDDAIAAAQADYDSRILSAITPSPQHQPEGSDRG